MEYVPEAFYPAIVQQKIEFFKCLPESKRTTALCLAVVTKQGTALEFVPEDKHSEEICLAAVQNDEEALKFVPLEKRSEEICLAALKQLDIFTSPDRVLQYVPEKHLLAVIQWSGGYLRYVPKITAPLNSVLLQSIRMERPWSMCLKKSKLKKCV